MDQHSITQGHSISTIVVSNTHSIFSLHHCELGHLYQEPPDENKRKLPRKEKPYGNTWKSLLSQASLVLYLFFHTRHRYPDLLRLRLQYQFYTSCAHSFQRAYHPHHLCLSSFPDFSGRDPGLLRFAADSWSHNVLAQESALHCAESYPDHLSLIGTAPLGGGTFGFLSHTLDRTGDSPYACFIGALHAPHFKRRGS
jgi:hypothetical protein